MAKDRVIYPQDHKPPTKKQIELHNMRKVFKEIGGWRNMAKWARENEGDFYTKVWAKTLRPDTSDDSPVPQGGSVIIIEGVDPVPRDLDGKPDADALYAMFIGDE